MESFEYKNYQIGPVRHRFSYEQEGNIILPKTKKECKCKSLEKQNKALVEALKDIADNSDSWISDYPEEIKAIARQALNGSEGKEEVCKWTRNQEFLTWRAGCADGGGCTVKPKDNKCPWCGKKIKEDCK